MVKIIMNYEINSTMKSTSLLWLRMSWKSRRIWACCQSSKCTKPKRRAIVLHLPRHHSCILSAHTALLSDANQCLDTTCCSSSQAAEKIGVFLRVLLVGAFRAVWQLPRIHELSHSGPKVHSVPCLICGSSQRQTPGVKKHLPCGACPGICVQLSGIHL